MKLVGYEDKYNFSRQRLIAIQDRFKCGFQGSLSWNHNFFREDRLNPYKFAKSEGVGQMSISSTGGGCQLELDVKLNSVTS